MWHKTFGKVPAILPASGGGGKILLTTRCSFLQRKVMTAGTREGEKNAGQSPVWEKVAPCLPEPARTGSRQRGHWLQAAHAGEGSQPTHLCLWAIPICLPSGLPLGMKKQHLFPWRGEQSMQEKLGKVMAAAAGSHRFWASHG